MNTTRPRQRALDDMIGTRPLRPLRHGHRDPAEDPESHRYSACVAQAGHGLLILGRCAATERGAPGAGSLPVFHRSKATGECVVDDDVSAGIEK